MKLVPLAKALSPLLAVAVVASCVGYQVVNFEPDKYEIVSIADASGSDTDTETPELPDEEELPEQTEAEGLADEELETIEESGEYIDGTYTGSGTGFAGTVYVSVIVADGQISSITVTGHSDGDSYMSRAKTLISNIISGQTTNVDTVSGATYSSKGIITAVRNALSKASASGTVDVETTEETASASSSSTAGVYGTIPYLAGTYYGTAEGYLDDITVQVVISKNTITGITVTEENDDAAFFSRASAVIDAMVSGQTTNVDTVSGATYSSKGIINAVKAALENAEAATTLANIGISSGGNSSSGNSGSGSGGTSGDAGLVTGMYKDGTYNVSAVCIPDEDEDFDAYTLSLQVVIENDRIVSITNVAGDGDSSNDSYIKRAANGTGSRTGVITQILNNQSTEGVDAVSRATCSSNAIVEAVNAALVQAAQ